MHSGSRGGWLFPCEQHHSQPMSAGGCCSWGPSIREALTSSPGHLGTQLNLLPSYPVSESQEQPEEDILSSFHARRELLVKSSLSHPESLITSHLDFMLTQAKAQVQMMSEGMSRASTLFQGQGYVPGCLWEGCCHNTPTLQQSSHSEICSTTAPLAPSQPLTNRDLLAS